MVTDREATNAVKLLKQYCKEKTCGDDCIFRDREVYGCTIFAPDILPYQWNTEEDKENHAQ